MKQKNKLKMKPRDKVYLSHNLYVKLIKNENN